MSGPRYGMMFNIPPITPITTAFFNPMIVNVVDMIIIMVHISMISPNMYLVSSSFDSLIIFATFSVCFSGVNAIIILCIIFGSRSMKNVMNTTIRRLDNALAIEGRNEFQVYDVVEITDDKTAPMLVRLRKPLISFSIYCNVSSYELIILNLPRK